MHSRRQHCIFRVGGRSLHRRKRPPWSSEYVSHERVLWGHIWIGSQRRRVHNFTQWVEHGMQCVKEQGSTIKTKNALSYHRMQRVKHIMQCVKSKGQPRHRMYWVNHRMQWVKRRMQCVESKGRQSRHKMHWVKSKARQLRHRMWRSGSAHCRLWAVCSSVWAWVSHHYTRRRNLYAESSTNNNQTTEGKRPEYWRILQYQSKNSANKETGIQSKSREEIKNDPLQTTKLEQETAQGRWNLW